eukprot:6744017-Prymnesium_polylepis.2
MDADETATRHAGAVQRTAASNARLPSPQMCRRALHSWFAFVACADHVPAGDADVAPLQRCDRALC